MLIAFSLLAALALPAADPSDPAEPPPAAPTVPANETAPPAPVVAPVDPTDPVVPVVPLDPTDDAAPIPRREPDPASPAPPTTTAPAKPKPPPPPEPPTGIAKNPMALGAGAALGGCAGVIIPGGCGLVFGPALLALPCTVPIGVIAGTAAAAELDEGKPETTSLFVGGALAVVAAGVLGGAVGAGLGALSCTPNANSLSACEYTVPIFAAVGGALGFTVAGPVAAGVTVGLLASQAAHPLTPPG